MTVTRKLFLLLLVAAILPLLVAAGLVWRSASEALARVEYSRLASEAESSARELASLTAGAREELRRLAGSRAVRVLLDLPESELGELLPEVGAPFELAILYDPDGRLLARSAAKHSVFSQVIPEQLPPNALEALGEWMRTEGEEATHFVCPMRAEVMNLPHCSQNFCMGFVRAVDGPRRGWIYGSVCWNYVLDALGCPPRTSGAEVDLNPADEPRLAVISEQPLAFVGIEHRSAERVRQVLPEFETWVATGRSQGLAVWDGIPVALGLAPICLASERPMDRWWIAAGRPLGASDATLAMLGREFIGALAAAVALAVALAALVGSGASRRLRALALRARALGSREREVAGESTADGDEIASLGNAFDRLEQDLERKRSQLRAAIERLADLVRSTPDPLFTFDLEGRVQHLNPAAEAMLGEPLSSVRGRSIWSRLRPRGGEVELARAFEDARRNGELTHLETRVGEREGEGRRLYALAVAPVRDRSGAIVKVLAILRDQTERAEAQDALAQQHAVLGELYALRSSGRSLSDSAFPRAAQILVEQLRSSFAGLFLEDAGRITWLGAAPGSASISELPRERAELARVLGAAGDAQILEHPLLDSRGMRRGSILLVHASSTRSGEAELLELVARWSAVELEVERLQNAAIQQAKMITVGGLAAGMAHEINNPLASILQNLQLLSFALDPSDRVCAQRLREHGVAEGSFGALATYRERHLAKYLERIEQAGGRATKIVSDLLSFSRSGRPALQRVATEGVLRRAIEIARVETEPQAFRGRERIDLRWEIAPGADWILCDPRQIEQVLLNLVQNAVHALRQNLVAGRGTDDGPRIHVSARPLDEDRIVIRVVDNGPGIEVHPPERVFEPFFTSKDVGQGTGLGLYVCWFLVTESNGGTIRVENDPQGGACFEIVLRAREVGAVPLATACVAGELRA